jgi:hypothetical protein
MTDIDLKFVRASLAYFRATGLNTPQRIKTREDMTTFLEDELRRWSTQPGTVNHLKWALCDLRSPVEPTAEPPQTEHADYPGQRAWNPCATFIR